jgi:protein-disulfide isomerase
MKSRKLNPSNKSGRRLSLNLITICVLVATVALMVIAVKVNAEQKFSSGSQVVAYTESNRASALQVTPLDHTKGNPSAKVVVVIYSDFQCPHCKEFSLVLKDLESQYGDRVLFVHRDYPLMLIHKNAFTAASVAEAAGRQGKFFEMQDMLFANQEDWSDSDEPGRYFLDYAKELGLNMTQFGRDVPAVGMKIVTDYQTGMILSIPGTPSIFVNGQAIADPRKLSTLINDALTKN